MKQEKNNEADQQKFVVTCPTCSVSFVGDDSYDLAKQYGEHDQEHHPSS